MQLVTVVIPTYAKILKEEGCLIRLLNSIKRVEGNSFRVIILDTTDPIDTSVEEKIESLVERYKDSFPIMHSSVLDMWKLHEYMEENGFGKLNIKLNFDHYSNFRNVGLIIANILRSRVVVMVDDDEIITDKNFFKTIRDGLGEKFYGKKILGKTGFYTHNGEYKIKPKGLEWKKHWPSVQLINKTMQHLVESPHRFNNTTIALAGIIVLTDRLYINVPFDPYCKRGEDSNYVISCKQLGYKFVFDNKLSVEHHPPQVIVGGPSKKSNFYQRFRQDIYRFIYERERLENFDNVDVEDLDPYPGFFLRDDLEYRAASVCINYATRALKNKDREAYLGQMRNLKIIFKNAENYADKNAGRFLRFQKRWSKMMKEIRKDKKLFNHFNRF